MSKDWSFVLHFGRRSGKTTAMAEVTKKMGGTLVCMSAQHAQLVAEDFGIKTSSIHRPESLRGLDSPILFDTDAVGLLVSEYETEVQKLQKQLRDERLRADQAESRNDLLRRQIRLEFKSTPIDGD